MEKIKISNIEIEIQKKNIKRMYIYVLPPMGNVRVSVPQNIDADSVRTLLMTKIPWIRKQKEKLLNQPQHLDNKYVSGEDIYLWGRHLRLEVSHDHKRNQISVEGNRLLLNLRELRTPKYREGVLNQWYRMQLKKEIPILLEKWQKEIGVVVFHWGVRNMKTRWGTCNIKAKRIWLNLQLAKRPYQCLEYVLVHELVHLLEKNHTKIFMNHMDTFIPEWREIKNQLNSYNY